MPLDGRLVIVTLTLPMQAQKVLAASKVEQTCAIRSLSSAFSLDFVSTFTGYVDRFQSLVVNAFKACFACFQVERIRKLMEPWKFEKLHGAFATAGSDGSAIVQRSAKRYIGFLDGTEKRKYF